MQVICAFSFTTTVKTSVKTSDTVFSFCKMQDSFFDLGATINVALYMSGPNYFEKESCRRQMNMKQTMHYLFGNFENAVFLCILEKWPDCVTNCVLNTVMAGTPYHAVCKTHRNTAFSKFPKSFYRVCFTFVFCRIPFQNSLGLTCHFPMAIVFELLLICKIQKRTAMVSPVVLSHFAYHRS